MLRHRGEEFAFEGRRRHMLFGNLPELVLGELAGIVFDLERRPSRQRLHTDNPGVSGKGFRGLLEIFVWLHRFH